MRSCNCLFVIFFFSSRRRHTRFKCDWSSDVCSSDLALTSTPQHHLDTVLIRSDPWVASLHSKKCQGERRSRHDKIGKIAYSKYITSFNQPRRELISLRMIVLLCAYAV